VKSEKKKEKSETSEYLELGMWVKSKTSEYLELGMWVKSEK